MTVMETVNRRLNIKDSYQAPDRMLSILLENSEATKQLYFGLLEDFKHDLSYNWFHQYFEDEHADRKNIKQDFTPQSISKLITGVVGKNTDGVIYEPSAGTGDLIIANWYKTITNTKPFFFMYEPNNYLYVAQEVSTKTVPFLLFNLSLRGINALVIHGNTLQGTVENEYFVINENNDCMGFSQVLKSPRKPVKENQCRKLWEEV